MSRIKTLCASLMLFCIIGVSVFAQGGYQVKGVVVDAVGPVIGATVIEQGTSNGVSTGLDGDYTLTVSKADAVVEVTCIGYATQTFVASQLPKTVTLTEDSQFLDEVVVIGYGTVKKEDMTGSITAIKSEELNRGAMVNTQDMLKGKVPGLHVIPGDGGPGAGSTIRIRGAASLAASNDPLIVIDGVPVAHGAGSGMSNPLDMINPNDIESFTVLKDASSAAIYGSRASNGVILITTKKGKGSKPQVSYNGSMSVQQNSKRMPVMTPQELREFVNEAYAVGSKQHDWVISKMGTANTEWQDYIFRTAISHDHNVSLNGNVKNMMPYRVSLGYTDQHGTLQGSTYDRGTVDFSLAPSFFDKHLTISLNAKGVYTYSNYADGGAVGTAAFYNPTLEPFFRNSDGSVNTNICHGYFNYGTYNPEDGTFISTGAISPLSMLYEKVNNERGLRFVGNAAIDYKVHGFEALRFNVSLGMDVSQGNSYNGVNPYSVQAWADTENPGIGQYSRSSSIARNHVLEAYANYNEEWGKHKLDVMAGYSWQHVYNGGRSISYFNNIDPGNTYPTEEQLANGTIDSRHPYGTTKLNGNETIDSRYPYGAAESYLVSFYARVNYSIASKYLFTASVRTDGSSKFSPATRWGVFPSGAFAWNIKGEDFLKNAKAVSQLKLRLSAGMTGQQDGIDNYAHLARYGISNDVYFKYNMGLEGYQFMMSPSAYDPDIKWETTTTYNVGLDFGFLEDRITGPVDAYLRNTNDLLNTVNIPTGSNFGNSLFTNIGSLQNKGLEFALNFIPVQTNDWHLSIGVNGTFQDTKFTKLNSTDDPNYYIATTGGVGKGTGTMLSRHQVGFAPYAFYVYKQVYDRKGNPIQNAFEDISGPDGKPDGKITEADRYCAGDPNPDFYYGINVKLSYKNWDFGFNGHGSLGYKVFNNFASANSTAFVDVNQSQLSNFAKAVKNTGFTAANSAEQWLSDMFVEDASFFRMDDINLGYTFKDIRNWKGNIRVAASCQNVFVLTGFSGIDPEVKDINGVSNTFWPRPRTYSLRLNINF